MDKEISLSKAQWSMICLVTEKHLSTPSHESFPAISLIHSIQTMPLEVPLLVTFVLTDPCLQSSISAAATKYHHSTAAWGLFQNVRTPWYTGSAERILPQYLRLVIATDVSLRSGRKRLACGMSPALKSSCEMQTFQSGFRQLIPSTFLSRD